MLKDSRRYVARADIIGSENSSNLEDRSSLAGDDRLSVTDLSSSREDLSYSIEMNDCTQSDVGKGDGLEYKQICF